MAVNTKRIKEVSLLQHDSTDCGAACLATVIRHFGGEAGIEKIRILSGTNQSGTTLLGLYQAAIECGMEAEGYEASVTDILTFEGILILHLTPEKGHDHYVVSYGYSDEHFTIWDPAYGLTMKTRKDLEQVWQSGRCLSVSPGKGFILKRAENKEKRRWIAETVKADMELLITSILIGILISLLGVVMAVYTQKLIDKILPSEETGILIIASALVFLLLASRVILSAIRQYILLSQGKMYNIRIIDSFYGALLDLPKPFFDSRKSGDLVARLNDTMRIQRVISDIVSTYIIDVLILLITLVMIFGYSIPSGLISLMVLPIFFMLVFRWNKRIIASQRGLMAGYALNEGNFISTLRGITEIKSLRWQKIFCARNKLIFSDFQDRVFSLGIIKVKLGMLTGLAGTLYLIVLLVYASLEVMKSSMTQGELIAILSLSSALLPSVMNLALVSIPFSEARVAIERMFEFTRIRPESDGAVIKVADSEITKLSLEKISFRYPGQKLLLSDISLDIEKGRIIALVGESGSGKSTLVNILMRFYQPEGGRISLNAITDSKMVSLEDWRRSIALVPQEVHLFNGTLLENILPEPDKVALDRLLKMTVDYGLESFVSSLPLGFATVTGEDGVKLSGGQKQILAFMRALATDPEILIVDEGTSGMDRDTEALILKILTRLRGRIGVLMVTHRINVIRRFCDKIYILEDGIISAAGSHDDLMSGENIYRRFWDDFK